MTGSRFSLGKILNSKPLPKAAPLRKGQHKYSFIYRLVYFSIDESALHLTD